MPKVIEYKSIDNLIFDPINPRLPIKYRGYDKDEEVLEWMILQENVIDLMGSIGQKGYFPAEPLLLVASPTKPGKFEVIEGNRRFAAVKLLNEPHLATVRKSTIDNIVIEAPEVPKELPVIIFEERQEITVYLGYRHITGVKQWGALAKARYLEELRTNLGIKNTSDEFKELAKIIGSKANTVRALLAGLEVYKVIEAQNFFQIPDLDEVNIEFGVLYTAVGKKNISTFVGIDVNAEDPIANAKVKNLEELTTWMFKRNTENSTRIGDSRNLKYLDKILDESNQQALKVFREGKPLMEAILYTDEPLVAFVTGLNESLDSLKVAYDQLRNVQGQTGELHQNLVKEIINTAEFIKKSIS